MFQRAVATCTTEIALGALATIGYDVGPVVEKGDQQRGGGGSGSSSGGPLILTLEEDPVLWAELGHAFAREEQVGVMIVVIVMERQSR